MLRRSLALAADRPRSLRSRPPPALGGAHHHARRRQVPDHLRAAPATIDAGERARGARRRADAGEFYCQRPTHDLRPLRRARSAASPPRRERAGCSRSTAPRRRSAPTRSTLKDGDAVLWYWADFGDGGPARRRSLEKPPARLLSRRFRQDDKGARTVAAGVRYSDRRRRRAGRRPPARFCLARHPATSSDVTLDGAVRSNALRVTCARLVALLALAAAARRAAAAGSRRRRRHRDAVGDARPRRDACCSTRRCPPGLTVLQALDREADVETRYGGRFVQAVDGIEGSLERGDDWFFFVNGVAARRAAPPSTGCATATSPGGTTATWRGASTRTASSSARSRSRSCTASAAGPRPAVVRYAPEPSQEAARAIAEARRRPSRSRRPGAVPSGANVFALVAGGRAARRVRRGGGATGPGAGSRSPVAVRARSRPTRLAYARRYRARELRPVPAAILLAALGVAALLARHIWSVAAIAAAAARRLPARPAPRARLYLFGALFGGLGVLVLSPFLQSLGRIAALDGADRARARRARRHARGAPERAERAPARRGRTRVRRLRAAASTTTGSWRRPRFARRSALAVALATRLVPTLERDAVGLAEAVRGRGVERRRACAGTRGCSRRSSPARSSGRRTWPRRWRRAASAAAGRRARPRPPWTARRPGRRRGAAPLVIAGALWL